MRHYFTSSGYSMVEIPTANSINGVDGCFVKRNFSGRIIDVLFVESKVNTSRLGTLVTGEVQGSFAYNAKQITKALSIQGNTPSKDLLQIKALLDCGAARSIVQRVAIDGTRIKITHQYVNGNAGASKVEFVDSKVVVDFDYTKPRNSYEDGITKTIEKSVDEYLFKKGVSQRSRLEVISNMRAGKDIFASIKNALRELPSNSRIKDALIVKDINKIWERTQIGAKVVNIKESSSDLASYERSIPKSAFGSAVKMGAAAGGIVFAIESSVNLYQYLSGEIGDGDLETQMLRASKHSAVSGVSAMPVTMVTGAILQDGRILCATNAGFFIISIEMGLASYELLSADIDMKEFISRAENSIIRGAAVGGVTYVAVFLGATPGGLVVLAVGAGAYLITDLAIKEVERQKWVDQCSIEELRSWGINIDSMYKKQNPTSSFEMVNPSSFERGNRNSSFLPKY